MRPLARPVDELLVRFEASYALLLADDEKRHFHGLSLRNTRAVKAEIDRAGFLNVEWVGRWVVAFANCYLDALEEWERAGTSPGPRQLAFEAARDPAIPPLRHQLVGLNTHLNFDLPQALLAVMSDEDWADPAFVARRHSDFTHIDTIVVRRVPEEYRKLLAVESPGDRTLLDRPDLIKSSSLSNSSAAPQRRESPSSIAPSSTTFEKLGAILIAAEAAAEAARAYQRAGRSASARALPPAGPGS